MRSIYLILVFLVLTTKVFSQEYLISGKITDMFSETIDGAMITIMGTKIFTSSDENGYYSIKVRESDILEITYVGYISEEIEIIELINRETNSSLTCDVVLNQEDNFFDIPLQELMNLKVTTVSKKEEIITETPQTVILITKEDIQNRGYTDIEQIFHDLPGFDISRGAGTEYSQIYQRGYRSNNTNRTLFLVDGVEQNDLWSNSAWISLQHSINEIERIEIIYGPASTVYGPNAFLGVVNIITKDADSIISDDNKFGIKSQSFYGSWNTWCTDITAAARINDFSFMLTSRVYQSQMPDLTEYDDWDYKLNNYDLDYYKDILGTENDSLAQLAKDLDYHFYYNDTTLNGILPHYSNDKKDWYINAKLKYGDFLLGVQSYRNQEGYGMWYRDDYELGPENGGSWGPFNTCIYSLYEKKIGTKLTLTSFSTFRMHSLKGNSNEEYYYYGYLNRELGLYELLQTSDTLISWNDENQTVDTAITFANQNPYWWNGWFHTYSQQFRTEMKILYNLNDKFSIISGLEYRHGYIQGSYLSGNTENPEESAQSIDFPGGNHFAITDIGLFTQANYYIFDNLNIFFGARVDHNQRRVTGGYGFVFNPKAALVFSPGKIILKAIYSEAIKDASSWDKFSTTPGRLLNNPDLKPEKVRNSEISLGWKINHNLFFDLSVYNADYSNVVGTEIVTFINEDGDTITTTQHQAVGRFQIQGVQSTLTFKFGKYSAYANYTFTNPYSINEGNTKVRIGDIASNRINVGGSTTFLKKLNLSLRINYVGERLTGKNTTISGNPFDSVDAYFLLNGALTYNLYKGISLQVDVNNILNTEYFHPGVRSADGDYYAAKMPQYERSIIGKLYVNF